MQEPRYTEYREIKMNARIWHCRVFKSFQTITTRMWNLAGRLLYYQTDLKSRAVKFFIPKTWVITACWKSDFFFSYSLTGSLTEPSGWTLHRATRLNTRRGRRGLQRRRTYHDPHSWSFKWFYNADHLSNNSLWPLVWKETVQMCVKIHEYR